MRILPGSKARRKDPSSNQVQPPWKNGGVRILITGAAGQDGTILATQVSRQGHEVVGLVKPGTDTHLLSRYVPSTQILECDLADHIRLSGIVKDFAPEEIYNLGGFTSPGDSWDNEDEVTLINVESVRALLDSVRNIESTRIFQASSASVFEGADTIPQSERTARSPKSPYARSKVAAMDLIDSARKSGRFAVSGILYNHESPLRGEQFVTRRITMAVARIAAGMQQSVELGDIEVARDWGWAPDYTRAMTLMLRADVPHDYVLATEISHRLSFFLKKAFEAVGITNWRDYVISSADRRREVDTNLLVGDSSAAYRELGWRHTVGFDDMASAMVHHDAQILADPDALWTDFQ